MDYGDYYWGLYRDYYRDPFPHSLLGTREKSEYSSCNQSTPHDGISTGIDIDCASRHKDKICINPKLYCATRQCKQQAILSYLRCGLS